MTPQEEIMQLREDLRRAAERHGIAKLQWAADRQVLENTAVSFRWWTVVFLTFLAWLIWEPAHYVHSFPESWASKLANFALNPTLVSVWFCVCCALVLPLVGFLIFKPTGAGCEKAQDFAVGGLFGGAVGYALLTSTSMRLDIPHVTASHLSRTLLLAVAALLVACWHNSRVIRERQRRGEDTCDELAH